MYYRKYAGGIFLCIQSQVPENLFDEVKTDCWGQSVVYAGSRPHQLLSSGFSGHSVLP